MFLNAPDYSPSFKLKDVASGATVDFLLPGASGVYLVMVRDSSSGYLGSAILYVEIGSTTVIIVQDGTTGGLMTGACVPSITSVTDKVTLRFTNSAAARKVAVMALYNPILAAGINY